MSDTGHMLKLGAFTFEIGTAAYQRLSRTDRYRWVSQDRLDNEVAEQNVGRSQKLITLEGVVFPEFRVGGVGTPVGAGQIDAMRAVAETREPQVLVDGRGTVLGRFIIDQITEDADTFHSDGTPRRQSFKIDLRSYGEDESTLEAVGDTGVVAALSLITPAQLLPETVTLLPGLDPKFAALGDKDYFAGNLATKLLGGGLGEVVAGKLGEITSGLLTEFGAGFYGTIRDAAMSFGRDMGLSGNPFKFAMSNVAENLKSLGWKGAEQIITTGMPALSGFLGKLGVSDEAAAQSIVGVVRAATNSEFDAGRFVSGAAASLGFLWADTAILEGLGVNPGSLDDFSQVQRFPNLLAQLRGVREDSPSTWASLLPAADHGGLNALLDAFEDYDAARVAAAEGIPTLLTPEPVEA